MTTPPPAGVAIHGGAGTLRRPAMSPEREAAYHDGLRRALAAGRTVLGDGGSALDAVCAAVMELEDDPLFNAGRGAVFNALGEQEMDAAVMDGRQRQAGAVAGICGPRHPILAARAVMERSPHVLLAGDGARRFCREVGLEQMDAAWFHTEARRVALEEELRRRRDGSPDDGDESRKHGTVGAVALDRHGNLAAATSTGGMTAKAPGRIGDSPIIGAGTWADNATCAVSATGHGEFFLRYAVGHEIDARLRWAGQSLDEACHAVVVDVLAPIGGSGGLVAIDHRGTLCLPFNSEGMYRGYAMLDGPLHTALYREAYRTAGDGRR
jgi:isoaspartyl peptidase/L-asparaginase-like protein (Ntn-hydrolase superfamily)